MNYILGVALTLASLSQTLAKDDLDTDSGPFDLSKVPVSIQV